jgi:hypothetical protein
MVEINEGVRGPESASDLVAGEELAGLREEKAKQLERLGVDADADTLPTKLARGGVGLKDAEAVETDWRGVGHGRLENSVVDEAGRAGKIMRATVSGFSCGISGLRREILRRQR